MIDICPAFKQNPSKIDRGGCLVHSRMSQSGKSSYIFEIWRASTREQIRQGFGMLHWHRGFCYMAFPGYNKCCISKFQGTLCTNKVGTVAGFDCLVIKSISLMHDDDSVTTRTARTLSIFPVKQQIANADRSVGLNASASVDCRVNVSYCQRRQRMYGRSEYMLRSFWPPFSKLR